MRRFAFVSIFALLALVPSVQASPHIAGCPVFPANNPWNEPVASLPVAKHSAQMVANIGLNAPVMPDFGSPAYRSEVPIGDPITVVVNKIRWVHVHFKWPSQSNRGMYPLPSHVAIQGGPNSTGDRHVIVIDRTTCRDYELYDAHPHDDGSRWSAGAGAVFNLRSNQLRPRGWTSADAAGLPLLAGLARYSEVSAQRARSRAQVHRPLHRQEIRLPRSTLLGQLPGPLAAADGGAAAPQADRERLAAPPPGARDRGRAQALRA